MKTTHTAGEWTLNEQNREDMTIRAGKNGFVIAEVTSTGVAHFIGNQSEAEANARLIAASPDLLEALQTLLKSHRQLTFSQNHNLNDSPVEVQAQTAINKATGNNQ